MSLFPSLYPNFLNSRPIPMSTIPPKPWPPLQLVLIMILLTSPYTLFAQPSTDMPQWRLFNVFFRDMPQLHPDFEGPYAADYHQTGLVSGDLDGNGKPTFLLPASRNRTGLNSSWIDYSDPNRQVNPYSSNIAIANLGSLFFNEYYNDIPGINIGYNMTLNFTLDDPVLATYRWEKPFFFPLDNVGFGIQEGYRVTDPQLPPEFRDGVSRNFWFTTQMELTFYYRGGEIFRFNGDDDLYVFIDKKLTTCDLGGIHASRGCQVSLDSLNLTREKSYSMSIFHAERHTDASFFAVTTSVRPVNRPPTAANITISTRADRDLTINLQGFDPDNDRLSYVITTQPVLGQIANSALNPGQNSILYRAPADKLGLDTFQYIANDGVLNSITPAWIRVNVLPPKRPPIIQNITINTNVGETLFIQLKADAPDFRASDLKWFLTSNPKFGRAEIFELNQTLRYDALNTGDSENFGLQVLDPEGYIGIGYASGTVNPFVLVIPAGLPPPVVAGIVIGSVGGAALLGTAAAYYFYNSYMAAKFAAKWQEEWMKSNINENPLFVSNFKEQFNPLYNPNN